MFPYIIDFLSSRKMGALPDKNFIANPRLKSNRGEADFAQARHNVLGCSRMFITCIVLGEGCSVYPVDKTIE